MASKAPLVGVSPIIGGSPVRGMADACLAAIDVKSSAFGIAEHYGARANGGLLHGWLVAEVDNDCVLDGLKVIARPLIMKDLETSRDIARQICESVEKNTYSWEVHNITSSVSIGLADFDIEAEDNEIESFSKEDAHSDARKDYKIQEVL